MPYAYVYIIECKDKYGVAHYTGKVIHPGLHNLKRRITQHLENKGARWTRGKTKLRAAYTEHVDFFPEHAFKDGNVYDDWHTKHEIIESAFDGTAIYWKPAWRRCEFWGEAGCDDIRDEKCPGRAKCDNDGGEWLIDTGDDDFDEFNDSVDPATARMDAEWDARGDA